MWGGWVNGMIPCAGRLTSIWAGPRKSAEGETWSRQLGELGRHSTVIPLQRGWGCQSKEPAAMTTLDQWPPAEARQRERHDAIAGWTATDSAPTSVGLRVSVEEPAIRTASDPLPSLWRTWEWQDHVILQANPFSNQLTQHHNVKNVVRIGLTPGICSRLGWDEPRPHL